MRHHHLKCAALALSLFAAASAHAQTSGFDAGTEGWSATGDVAGPVTWVATGGNPDGHVQIVDSVTGGVTYFVAPSSFLGNQSAAIGTNLTFDLQQVYPGGVNQFDDSDVLLSGGGLTIAFNTANNPANGSWTSYAVPLSAAGWHLNTLSGAAVTDAQFLTVMSNLTALYIRAEYQTGADTGKLDNVSLTTPVPEPETYALLLAGLGLLPLVRRLRRQS